MPFEQSDWCAILQKIAEMLYGHHVYCYALNLQCSSAVSPVSNPCSSRAQFNYSVHAHQHALSQNDVESIATTGITTQPTIQKLNKLNKLKAKYNIKYPSQISTGSYSPLFFCCLSPPVTAVGGWVSGAACMGISG